MKIKDLSKIDKTIRDRVQRSCVICARKIKVILYEDRSYRGGHYFKSVGLTRKEPVESQYWECPKCYRTA